MTKRRNTSSSMQLPDCPCAACGKPILTAAWVVTASGAVLHSTEECYRLFDQKNAA